ncbi:WGR domain-containing protein [Agrobacterium cavarae]|uniref:WGR domain-containing protein n=1 Tax=Agrobacterium cavarae TaxID=2528239 RepID=UPI003EE4A2B8
MMPMPRPFYAERLDPARNMARFYALEVSADLFGAMWLERRWGRIGSRGQIKVELVDHGDDPSKRIETIARQKTRRGYKPK